MLGLVVSIFFFVCRLLIRRRKFWRVFVGVSWRGFWIVFKAIVCFISFIRFVFVF